MLHIRGHVPHDCSVAALAACSASLSSTVLLWSMTNTSQHEASLVARPSGQLPKERRSQENAETAPRLHICPLWAGTLCSCSHFLLHGLRRHRAPVRVELVVRMQMSEVTMPLQRLLPLLQGAGGAAACMRAAVGPKRVVMHRPAMRLVLISACSSCHMMHACLLHWRHESVSV